MALFRKTVSWGEAHEGHAGHFCVEDGEENENPPLLLPSHQRDGKEITTNGPRNMIGIKRKVPGSKDLQ